MTIPKKRSRRDRIVVKTEQLTASSRWLHTIDHYTSLPWATLVLLCALAAAAVVGAVLGFPQGWTTSFEVATSALTLVMVTVIQHTQGREQTATQRKLDELLRAIPNAEDALIMVEEESDETIEHIEERQRRFKRK